MECRDRLCVYNKDYKCTQDEIFINAYGACFNCQHLRLDDEIANKAKADTLQNLNEYLSGFYEIEMKQKEKKNDKRRKVKRGS